MAVQIPGLISIIIFYIIIAVIGIIAGRKSNKSGTSEELFLANRNLGMFVASFTTAASMVGGAYVNGTAEAMGRDGLAWCIGPIGYNIGMTIAGIFFAPKVRRAGYMTILDPFQRKYGNKMGALLFIPEFFGDLFWEAAVLAALGTTLAIILDLNMTLSVIVSACVAIGYTFFGGLYSVAYTDVIQLFFIIFGLVFAIPFAITSDAVDLSRIGDSWVGTIPPNLIGMYVDTCCMVVMGGIPWQALYQRVLATKSPEVARNSTLIAAVISFSLAIPPATIGIVGRAADWNATGFDGDTPLTYTQWAHIFPMVLEYLTPTAVSVVGIGAVSAAVMSSADSCVLATGSIFANNLYSKLVRPKASERELVWVLRVSIVVVGALGTLMAVTVESVYGLFILCSDLMYVIQFPQLVCVLWIPFSNVYGSLLGFILGLFLRLSGGEPFLKLPALIQYPFYDETYGQLFPFKTMSMLVSMITIVVTSYLTHFLFTSGKLDKKFDFLKSFQDEPSIKKTDDKDNKEPLMNKNSHISNQNKRKEEMELL